MLIVETLENFIKQNTQQKGKKRTKRKNQVQANKTCYKVPLVTKNISKIKKDEKPKKTINLEKPSPIMKMHLQIKVT
jgi:hypothetical protein